MADPLAGAQSGVTPSAVPPPTATAWDAQGNPVQRSAAPSGPTAWDAQGNPVQKAAAASGGTPSTGFDTLDYLRSKNILNDADIGMLRGAAKTYTGLADTFDKWGKATTPAVIRNMQPESDFFKKAHAFANQAPASTGESVGEGSENLAELFSGQELLGMLGETAKGAEALKGATKVAEIIKAHPVIGRLLKIGQSAVQQGALAAGQTAVKTGGDTGAAGTAGLETGLLTGGLNALTEGAGGVARAALKQPQAAAAAEAASQKGAEEYAQHAQGAIRPTLENVNANIPEPKLEWQKGPTGAQGEPVASNPPKPINIDQQLKNVNDYRWAKTTLQNNLNEMQQYVENASGTKFPEFKAEFSKLRGEIDAARADNWANDTPKTREALTGKLGQLSDLFSNAKGSASPELMDSLNAGWRQYYALDDITKTLNESAINGIPDGTQTGMARTGINGKALAAGLQSSVEKYGRETVENALGGSDRFRALEDIAKQTRTIAGKAKLNDTIVHIAGWMTGGAAGAAVGHATGLPWGGYVGGHIGGLAGTAAVRTVYRAVLANPKLAQNVLYAADHARPEVYGPFIANMIQTNETQASRERQQEQQK